MTQTVLSNLVSINSRYTRSVNLERDFYAESGLEGYVLTTAARLTLGRIAKGLSDTGGSRAWTLTGPYGSGKSAFALFLASLLTENSAARELLRSEEENLHKALFDARTKTALPKGKFLPVLATGAREPVATAILRGLRKSLKYLGGPVAMSLIPAVEELLDEGAAVSERRLVTILESILQDLTEASEVCGMVLVLDELGKHLEFAALNSDSGDLYVLQSLAEMAQRNKVAPVVMVTLLHQSFERYAERLTSLERSEWSKVQGRFEDVAFQEGLEQILRLISGAIEFVGSQETREPWNKKSHVAAQEAASLGLRPPSTSESTFIEQLQGVYPLHPTVAMVLGPLFRKLAQNERSLFAFLSAHEPHGFQDYLLTTAYSPDGQALYTIDFLYDYIVQALGGGLFNSSSGRRWAEIDSSLARLTSESPLERRVVKVIGMLSAVGQFGEMKATPELIAFSLGMTKRELLPLLESLCDRSILVYRGFQKAYGLWEGSDFDLEEKLRSARSQVSVEETLSDLLRREQPIRPLVARRHTIQTGTLRYFEVRYALSDELVQVVSQPLRESDGALVVVFANSDSQRATVQEIAAELKNRPELLLVEPEHTPVLHGYLHDISCLRWIMQNSPELQGDAVARKEVHARISEIQQTLKQFLDSLLDQTSSSGRWFHRGQRIRVGSRRQLTAMLSTICDDVYPSTPHISNELVNRRTISTSAAAARNILLQAMLDAPSEKKLGFTDHPPARSIYESLFGETGIHRCEEGKWGFFSPPEHRDNGIKRVWKEMEQFLDGSEGQRKSIDVLFRSLQAPPFGMKAGCLPLVLCAFLQSKHAEAALYEESAFVPALTLPHLERLIKTPGKFHLQKFRVDGVRSNVFERYLGAFTLGKQSQSTDGDILDVVRPLCYFAETLPEYSRNTQQLSETAMRVRRALFKAVEPAKLLFEELPEACGVATFQTDSDAQDVEIFFTELGRAIRELQHTYDRLLEDIEQRFCQTFSLTGHGEDARSEFVKQAAPVKALALDDQLKSFLVRSTDEYLEIKGWVESIATVLVSKPPRGWNDKDRAVFENNLREVSKKYNQLEALALEVEGGLLDLDGDEMLCVDITNSKAEHVQRVVRLTRKESSRISKLQSKLDAWLDEEVGNSPSLRLALLAKLSQGLITKAESATEGPATEQLLLADES